VVRKSSRRLTPLYYATLRSLVASGLIVNRRVVAIVTMRSEEQLTGRQLSLRTNAVYDALPPEFDGTVASLTIR